MATSAAVDYQEMTESEALEIVVETAFDWAQEYGFSVPERASTVWKAAKYSRPGSRTAPT